MSKRKLHDVAVDAAEAESDASAGGGTKVSKTDIQIQNEVDGILIDMFHARRNPVIWKQSVYKNKTPEWFFAHINRRIHTKCHKSIRIMFLRHGERSPSSLKHCTYSERQHKELSDHDQGIYLFEGDQCRAAIEFDLGEIEGGHIYAKVHDERTGNGIYHFLMAVVIMYFALFLSKTFLESEALVFASMWVLHPYQWKSPKKPKTTKEEFQKKFNENDGLFITIDPLHNFRQALKQFNTILDSGKFHTYCQLQRSPIEQAFIQFEQKYKEREEAEEWSTLNSTSLVLKYRFIDDFASKPFFLDFIKDKITESRDNAIERLDNESDIFEGQSNEMTDVEYNKKYFNIENHHKQWLCYVVKKEEEAQEIAKTKRPRPSLDGGYETFVTREYVF